LSLKKNAKDSRESMAFFGMPTYRLVPEQGNQNNDGNRHAEKIKQDRSHGIAPIIE
jgi:hypothetical protein